ncbi:S8 family serine peptidase [Bacillus sp. FJAT-27251]|uniref:S8 family serine peptidase n=1 Tax=Bacillus sp. FJAT-27251 TaxID=1684142 RepID=UPI0006A7CB4B|nr:S8 family serine peptidase [Bacillus sp. FJAT-27251]
MGWLWISPTIEQVEENAAKKEDMNVLNNPAVEQVIPWNVKLLNPQTSQNKNSTNENRKVKVAILDSGINKDHEDLVGVVKKQYNAISPEEPVIDDFGHGTAIAGIIGANNNDIGVLGLNSSGVELYDVKVLDAKGKGNIDYLVDGIEWSIKEEVNIINISSGITSDKEELRRVIDKAVSSGIMIVAAAGNTYGTGVEYPAKYDGVLSINSINKDFKRPSSAARGKIDYAAPGVDIVSTNHSGGYGSFTGTSFAAAHATAVISLYLNDSRNVFNSDELLETIHAENHHNFSEEQQGKGLITYKP